MHRFFSFRQMPLIVGALSVMFLGDGRAVAAETEFHASGSFIIVSIEDYIGHVIATSESQPGGTFDGTLVERYYGNISKIGNVHKIQGAGVFNYGSGDSLYFEFELLYNVEPNIDAGLFIIAGGTGALVGATGGGIHIGDHALEGNFGLVGTISL